MIGAAWNVGIGVAFSRGRCTSYARRDPSIKIKPYQDLG
jgi:hypothetical protein